jgi:hypothetical protein
MTPENARRAANTIVAAAGVALAVLVVSQPRLRRMVMRLAPVALRQIRPIHVIAVVAALTGPAVAAPSTSTAHESRRADR